MPPRAVPALAIVVTALLMACSPTAPLPPGSNIVVLDPEPSTGPFAVVAVDDHFHDIHPFDRTKISEDRPFVVKNEGRNLHNFTVVGTAISVDIRPGSALRWSRLGDHLPPGSYTVLCKYHAYVGMTGTFAVTP